MNEEIIKSLQDQGYAFEDEQLEELSNNELIPNISEEQIVDYFNLQKKVAAAEENPTPENVEAAKEAQEQDIAKDEQTEATLNGEAESASEAQANDEETAANPSEPVEATETNSEVPAAEHPEDEHKEVI
jgi:hypothetical protein